MDEEFDAENEHFYAINGEYDCSSNSNQSYFVDFDEIAFNESNLKSMHKKISSQCHKTNDVLTPITNFSEKNQITISENPIERFSIHNNESKIYEIQTQKKNNLLMAFKKNPKKDQKINYCYNCNLPNVNVKNMNDCKVYQMLFKATGAYLTQNELTYLRKTIFKNIMPIMTRDEQRSKVKNIERFEKFHDKIIPILQNPNITNMIQNYLLNRRRNHEKMDMIENLYKNFQKES